MLDLTKTHKMSVKRTVPKK